MSVGFKAPEEWFDLLERLKRERGVALLLGTSGAGKTSLARFLISQLYRQGLTVALIDADIGQYFLSPPAAMGLAVFRSPQDWEAGPPVEMFFVGSSTPDGHLPILLKGTKRMVDKAVSYGAELILVDTTGLVSGEAGVELKRKKIDLVSPRFLLALQESGEIEPILASYEGAGEFQIVRLGSPVPERHESPEEERIRRTNQLRDYFSECGIKEFPLDPIRIEAEIVDPDGEVLPSDALLGVNGLLIGLKDRSDNTLALGVIRTYSAENRTVRISTPLDDIQGVTAIQLGSFRLIPCREDRGF
jgi:polynucleotide 5'-hydroxyl-kinase GRC3/NOL9